MSSLLLQHKRTPPDIPTTVRTIRAGAEDFLIKPVPAPVSKSATRLARPIGSPGFSRSHLQDRAVKKLNSAKGRAATSTVSVRAMASGSDVAQPVELLSCAGSCTCSGSCTCAPHLTSLVPSCAPRLTSLVPSCAPLLTPLHANGLSLSIRYCQYRRSRREAERSRKTQQRKGLPTRDRFRLHNCAHVKPP